MSDVIIVGGGLAGSVASIHLARAGAAVTLIERSAGPHDKVCGEFLSSEALEELRLVGVDPDAMGAPGLDRVRVASGDRSLETVLPFPASSLTRRRLDEALLDRALASGVEVRRGVAGSRVARDDSGWRVRLSDDRELTAPHLVQATGKHDLRGQKRPDGLHADLVGLKSYLRLDRRATEDIAGTVDVIFFPGGYLGLQPVESGLANACLVVSRRRLAALGGDPWAVFRHVGKGSSHAAGLLGGAEPAMAKPLAIGRIPYGYVRMTTNGAYHVGDQAAVIPSFCGEGMGLALRSGRMAAEAIAAGRDAARFQRRFARLVYARVKGTALLSRLLSQPPIQSGVMRLAVAMPTVVTSLAAATRTPYPRGGRSSSATPSAS